MGMLLVTMTSMTTMISSRALIGALISRKTIQTLRFISGRKHIQIKPSDLCDVADSARFQKRQHSKRMRVVDALQRIGPCINNNDENEQRVRISTALRALQSLVQCNFQRYNAFASHVQ